MKAVKARIEDRVVEDEEGADHRRQAGQRDRLARVRPRPTASLERQALRHPAAR